MSLFATIKKRSLFNSMKSSLFLQVLLKSDAAC
jgi:hypothetical protein